MVASNFDAALARVLVHEGGYSNHPSDPGGPTMRGVIQRVYDAYRKGKGLPERPVRQLDDDELKEIYRRQYWDAIRADELPAGLDYVVFDGAVNSGPAQSAKWLQRSLSLPADGQVGAVTLEAAATCSTPEEVVETICDRRLAMLRSLSTWPVFGKGWARRVEDVRRAGQAWARAGAAPAAGPAVHDAVPHAAAKAPVGSARPSPKPEAGARTAAGGILATSIAEATRQIEPMAGASPKLAAVFTGLTLLGLAVTLGGLGYVWWSARGAAKRAEALDLAPVAAGTGAA